MLWMGTRGTRDWILALRAKRNGGTDTSTTTSKHIVAYGWHHLAFVYKKSERRLYFYMDARRTMSVMTSDTLFPSVDSFGKIILGPRETELSRYNFRASELTFWNWAMCLGFKRC